LRNSTADYSIRGVCLIGIPVYLGLRRKWGKRRSEGYEEREGIVWDNELNKLRKWWKGLKWVLSRDIDERTNEH
jgi:hypothetical protein